MRVDWLPEKLKEHFIKQNHKELVQWEVTGHAHRLDKWEVYYAKADPSGDNSYTVGYFVVPEWETANLTHEEHKTLEYWPWTYWFGVQREYDPVEERRVLD